MDEVRAFQIAHLELAVGHLTMARMIGDQNAVLDVAALKIGQVIDRLRQRSGNVDSRLEEAPCSEIGEREL